MHSLDDSIIYKFIPNIYLHSLGVSISIIYEFIPHNICLHSLGDSITYTNEYPISISILLFNSI